MSDLEQLGPQSSRNNDYQVIVPTTLAEPTYHANFEPKHQIVCNGDHHLCWLTQTLMTNLGQTVAAE